MEDLFSQLAKSKAPLADRMRPRTLDEFIGQKHVVGPGRLLAPRHRGGQPDLQHFLRAAWLRKNDAGQHHCRGYAQ